MHGGFSRGSNVKQHEPYVAPRRPVRVSLGLGSSCQRTFLKPICQENPRALWFLYIHCITTVLWSFRSDVAPPCLFINVQAADI